MRERDQQRCEKTEKGNTDERKSERGETTTEDKRKVEKMRREGVYGGVREYSDRTWS